jgi:hypothetical protein
MKTLLLGLGLAALITGCSSPNNSNSAAVGGTGEQYQYYSSSGGQSSGAQFHSNATLGTGSSLAPNNATPATF